MLATYNRRHLLSRAIDSVLNQSTMNWELLIVDDGSEDNTEEFLKNVFMLNQKIRYFKRPHKGLAASRNLGIKNSVGKYITFLDSDDEFRKDHLELRLKYFEDNSNIDLIHGGVELAGSEETHYVKDKFDMTKLIHLSECVIGATLFGRRKVFELLNGFNDVYSEDSEFIERAIELFNIRKVDFSTYIYHTDSPDGICNTI